MEATKYMYKSQITKSVQTLKELQWKIGAQPNNWCHPTFTKEIQQRELFVPSRKILSVLDGLDPTFPKFMWDNLLVQTEPTINLLRESTLKPSMLAWEYFNSAFYYTATPLVPIGCKIIIHTTSNKQNPGTREDMKDLVQDWLSITTAASRQSTAKPSH